LVSPLEDGPLRSVNAYLFADDGGYTLVDSGVGSAEIWELFCAGLAGAGIEPRHIQRVLLTHSHHDHAGLAARLATVTGATVWIHERDLDYFNYRFVNTAQYQADLYRLLTTVGTPEDEAQTLAGSAGNVARVTPPFPSVERYRGGDVFSVGEYTLRVIWTPGHTPGHVCLCDAERGFVLCGDHVLPTVFPNVGMMPDSEVNPLPAYLDSMRSFAAADYRVALPGHGDQFDIGRRAQQLLDHQLERQARVQEILAEGPLTPYEVAERVWQDAGPGRWASFQGYIRRNAIQTVIAHLELLCGQGKVARSDEAPHRYELVRGRAGVRQTIPSLALPIDGEGIYPPLTPARSADASAGKEEESR
jgi:glyoxylase-like metal-dependent hydrolase (beta-lactamase superfamily II)